MLLVSPELDEILSLSDRIVVRFGGKILAIIPVKEATKKGLGLLTGRHSIHPPNLKQFEKGGCFERSTRQTIRTES